MGKVAHAYIDGSYNAPNKVYGSGAIILLPNNETVEIMKADSNNLSQYRNVTGECLACLHAIYKCITLQMDKVVIYYDYHGVGRWALGQWKANNPLTKMYVGAIWKYRNYIQIQFVKVKGHSGNHYNEIADTLAKKSVHQYIKEEL